MAMMSWSGWCNCVGWVVDTSWVTRATGVLCSVRARLRVPAPLGWNCIQSWPGCTVHAETNTHWTGGSPETDESRHPVPGGERTETVSAMDRTEDGLVVSDDV